MHDEDPGATHLPVCNFTSRIRCVNRFVIDYISDDHTLGTVSESHYGPLFMEDSGVGDIVMMATILGC